MSEPISEQELQEIERLGPDWAVGPPTWKRLVSEVRRLRARLDAVLSQPPYPEEERESVSEREDEVRRALLRYGDDRAKRAREEALDEAARALEPWPIHYSNAPEVIRALRQHRAHNEDGQDGEFPCPTRQKS